MILKNVTFELIFKKINSSEFLLLNRLLGTKVLKNTKHDRFRYILIKDMKVLSRACEFLSQKSVTFRPFLEVFLELFFLLIVTF